MFRVQNYKMFLFSPYKQYVVLYFQFEATLVTPRDCEELEPRNVLRDFYFGVLV